MTIENQFTLSFYKEVTLINEKHGVSLVQHVETKKLYVKKTVAAYNLSVYRTLKDARFPHIPVIQELIEEDGTLIVIEEYINGQNLEEILSQRLFSEEETKEILLQLCQILQPLHGHSPKIIHRDIKPSNLILDNQNQLYLIDFDASKNYDPKKSRDTVLMGTEDYAAPEQYGFLQSSEKTDIYSIGILANKMLTGRFPSEHRCSGALGAIIKKCTAMDPSHRYNSVTALASAIEKTRQESFALPGFRKRSPRNMILSAIWYIFICVFCFSLELTDTSNQPLTGLALRANQVSMTMVFFLWTFYFANYRKFKDRFPWKRSDVFLVDLLRIALGAIMLLMIPVILLSIVEGII